VSSVGTLLCSLFAHGAAVDSLASLGQKFLHVHARHLKQSGTSIIIIMYTNGLPAGQ
jgi:hypothetical protein